MISKTPMSLDLASWRLLGTAVETTTKHLSDTAGLYRDTTGVDPTTPVYTVDTYTGSEPDRPGDLFVGMTTLYPVTVNGECNMTRGHFHVDRAASEIYVGLSGRGLLVCMDETGEPLVEEVCAGSVHHILGNRAHRLVNTGTEDLRVFAVWPTTAGHDYEAAERVGFPYRVFEGGRLEPAAGDHA